MTKAATIKLRLSADEKAAWEAQAAADGVTLSALVRQRMNTPVVRADGVLEPLVTGLRPDSAGIVGFDEKIPRLRAECSAGGKAACPFPECQTAGHCSPRREDVPLLEADIIAAEAEGQPLKHYLALNPPRLPRMWGGTVDAEHVAMRRDAACEHARPPYAYCPECDA